MDFGAIQCTPQSPNFMFCPLADSCSALSKGQVMQLPVKQHRTKTFNRYFNYIYAVSYTHLSGTVINKKNGEVSYLTSPFLLFDFDFFLHGK